MTWSIQLNGHDDLTGDEKAAYENALVEKARALAVDLALDGGNVSSAAASTNTTGSVNLLELSAGDTAAEGAWVWSPAGGVDDADVERDWRDDRIDELEAKVQELRAGTGNAQAVTFTTTSGAPGFDAASRREELLAQGVAEADVDEQVRYEQKTYDDRQGAQA